MTSPLDRMMDFDLTEDQRLVRRAVREFAKKEILPHVEEHERAERYPTELIRKLVPLGYFVFDVPVRGSLPTLGLACALFLFGMLGQGLVISIVAKNQMVATQMATMTSMLPSMLLSVPTRAAGRRTLRSRDGYDGGGERQSRRSVSRFAVTSRGPIG